MNDFTRQEPIPFFSSSLDAYGFGPPPILPGGQKRSEPEAVGDVWNENDKLPRGAAARKIVHFLVEQGVDTFFGIPGGPITAVFEAVRLHPQARLVESRHENHAAFSGLAFYKATRRPACLLFTAGPGICNAITGIATAHLAGAPLLVMTGDISNELDGARMIQDSGSEGLNIDLMLLPITRRQIRIKTGARAVLQTGIALQAATERTNPGPVLLVLPANCGFENAPQLPSFPPENNVPKSPAQECVKKTATLLTNAQRPLIVIGNACAPFIGNVQKLVEFIEVPFITTPSSKGLISDDHEFSLRNGGLAASQWSRKYTAEAVDVCLVLGTDLDDVAVGPTAYIGAGGCLIHVDLNPDVFGHTLPTNLSIVADVGCFTQKLYEICAQGNLSNSHGRNLARKIQRNYPYEVRDFETDDNYPIAPHRVIADVQMAMSGKVRYVCDAGEHMLAFLQYLKIGPDEDCNVELSMGSMGNGIAGAIGYAVAEPGRVIVCVCGDGGMHMSGMEVLTALKMSLPVIYVIFNDSRYNMIYHGMKRVFGTAETNSVPEVDFAAWGASMGVQATVIRNAGEITAKCMEELMSYGGPVILDVRIDPDVNVSRAYRGEELKLPFRDNA